MKTLAAVLVATGRPLELAELEIPKLQPGQVLVEIACSGICHTQLLECRGHRGDDPFLPHCLGHEGSGVVVDTGSAVTRCRIGDAVILSWLKGPGADVGGTVYAWQDRQVNAGGVTTFSRHAVVSENRVTLYQDNLNPLQAALIGCAVATGVGAVQNTLQLSAGQSCAVFGAGGVGLCAIAAAAAAGASPIIAIDVREERLGAAIAMGATRAVNASTNDPVAAIADLCPGGVDAAIEASGRPDVMRQALESVRPRGGAAVIVGNARFGEVLQLDPRQFNQGKRLLGTWGGDSQPERDFGRYCELAATGKLNLAPLLNRTYLLTQINQALDDLEAGRCTRPLIDMRLT